MLGGKLKFISFLQAKWACIFPKKNLFFCKIQKKPCFLEKISAKEAKEESSKEASAKEESSKEDSSKERSVEERKAQQEEGQSQQEEVKYPWETLILFLVRCIWIKSFNFSVLINFSIFSLFFSYFCGKKSHLRALKKKVFEIERFRA